MSHAYHDRRLARRLEDSEFRREFEYAARTSKQVLVIRKDLGMRKGKMVAQGAHASIAWMVRMLREDREMLAVTEAQRAWLEGAFTKVCVGVASEEELDEVYRAALDAGLTSHLITDLGLTEFRGVPTKTCCAVGPDWSDLVDTVTGKLTLL